MSLFALTFVVLLALLAIKVLMLGAFTHNARLTGFATWVGVAVATAAGLWFGGHGPLMATLNGPLLIASPLTMLGQTVVGGLALLALPLGAPFLEQKGFNKPEYQVLFILSLVGMGILMMSSDLLSLYVGLELMSFSLYIMVAFLRDEASSSEAALKYFVLGSLASGLLLYGTSLIYTATGSTNFAGLVTAVPMVGVAKPLLLTGFTLVMVGLVFKLSVAPFHMWTPDVYEGAPTPTTAMMSALPKVAAFVVLVRLLNGPFQSLMADWQPALAVLAALSMAAGSLVAIVQTNLKRLLAYSTIANVGFILAGVVAATPAGTSGLMFYLITYGLTSLALFAVIELEGLTSVSQLAGLGKRRPWVAAAMLINLFSLAGVPPLAGFFAKFMVLNAAMQAGYTWLAIAGGLLSVVAAFYSLYLIKVMMFDPTPEGTPESKNNLGLELVLVVTTVIIVWAGLFPGTLTSLTIPASISLF